MRKYLYIFLAFLPVLIGACSSSSSQSTPSSVAKLTAFSFAKNDSIPGLAKAVFTIEERIDTGLVYNKDSILYGTSLERAVPRFTFATTPSSATLSMPDTNLTLTGYDTLNFEKLPIYLTIKSEDGKTTKVYEIRPSVHQADPDLYEWVRLHEGIYPPDDSVQRVVELANRFVMIANNGFQNSVFSSQDGITWTELGEPTGLPASCRVRQIISDGFTLYYADDTRLYFSSNAIDWDVAITPYKLKTMLFAWNDKVWVLVDNDGLELGMIDPGETSIDLSNELRPDGNFPISDFATVCFKSASQRERAMIIGGFAENGKSLNTRWNLEYSVHIEEHNGYRLSEFSIDRPTFTSLTGISVIWYNKQLLLFGGVDANMTYFGRDILISDDEGLNWLPADTAKNQLPEVYHARQKQNAIVRDNYIYLFGGQDQMDTYSDVYRGKLNSIDW